MTYKSSNDGIFWYLAETNLKWITEKMHYFFINFEQIYRTNNLKYTYEWILECLSDISTRIPYECTNKLLFYVKLCPELIVHDMHNFILIVNSVWISTIKI